MEKKLKVILGLLLVFIVGLGCTYPSNTVYTKRDFLNDCILSLTYWHGEDQLEYSVRKGYTDKNDINSPIYVTDAIRILQNITQNKEIDLLGSVSAEPQEKLTQADAKRLFDKVLNYTNSDTVPREVPLYTISDFFTNKETFSFALSPDGEYLMSMQEWEGKMNIFKTTPDKSKNIRITSLKDRDVLGFFIKEDRVIYIRDEDGKENIKFYSIGFDGSSEICLTPYQGVRANYISDIKNNKNEFLISMNLENKEYFDIYTINIYNGDINLVMKNPGGINSWIPDFEGNIRVAIESDGIKSTILYKENDKENFKAIKSTENGDRFIPFALKRDGKTLVCVSNANRDKVAVIEYNVITGEEKTVYEHPLYDVYNIYYNVEDDSVGYVSFYDEFEEIIYFDKNIQDLHSKVNSIFGENSHIVSFNKAKNKFIITIFSDKIRGEYYYYDLDKNESVFLGKINSTINADDLCEMIPISYKSRDGMTITGYLTLPQNREAKKLPLIVNPHGGPWERNYWGYNSEVQFLANRGYAVLQMNYRGSSGFGKAFLDAGNKQWGLKMQDDITDGVHWLINLGIVDSERVGIYGTSYGGYAALAGVTFTPDLYSAAVSYAGISNLLTFMDSIPPYWESQRGMLYSRIGNPSEEEEFLKKISPIFHIDQIKTPLFIAHGANDPRVSKNEADQMVKALMENNVNVVYLLKENEGHGFALEENILDFYFQMESFFDNYLSK